MFLVFKMFFQLQTMLQIGMFVPSYPTPNSYVEIITPHIMVLGGEAFGMQLAH